MSDTKIKTRIIHKHAVESDWAKAINFTPLKGELIVYDVDENYTYERIKIGDGVTNVNDLPFYSNKEMYIQNDEPQDAPDGSVWIDLDEDSPSGSNSHNHNDIYYTKNEIDAKISELNNLINKITDSDSLNAMLEEVLV